MPSQEPLPGPRDDQGKNFWVQMANYAQLAIVFPAATVVGWLLGVALDHWLHTSWLYIVGLILGIVAGFVELIRTATRTTF
jgi:F0F1-type ATP synthase assembly protein I